VSRLEAHFLGIPYVEQDVLYLIEIEAADELFLNCGISKSSVQDRYARTVSRDFLVKPLREIRGSMSFIVALEKEIKKRFVVFRHEPKLKVSGHTECYKIDALTELTAFFNEHVLYVL
jgi:hypothetical protein